MTPSSWGTVVAAARKIAKVASGNGFSMGQHRLAYGRLRHGMHNVAMAQRALDMATKHVTSRSTFGRGLDERQAVQFMLAECASQLYIARLMLLHIAYKAEHKMDIRQENGIAKVFLANMVHKVVDTAIQLHGAMGMTEELAVGHYFKRATVIESQLGDTDHHLARYEALAFAGSA